MDVRNRGLELYAATRICGSVDVCIHLCATGDYPDPDIEMCRNLPVCWVGALNEGLRSGDIGGFMDPRDPGDSKFLVQVPKNNASVVKSCRLLAPFTREMASW